jgi:hypothetical protein
MASGFLGLLLKYISYLSNASVLLTHKDDVAMVTLAIRLLTACKKHTSVAASSQ